MRTRWLILSMMTAALLVGCAGPGADRGPSPAAGSEAVLRVRGQPFAPASIAIFPLTQLELDEQGEPWLLLFIELRDRWGDPVKALGWLTVYLEPSDRSGGEHEARWDVDLTDASVNSALFDPVTRTYRVQLGGLPNRARVMAERSEQRRAGGDADGVRDRMVFRASFRTLGPRGEEVELWDTLDLDS